jgi:predicted nucleotidyltransferase
MLNLSSKLRRDLLGYYFTNPSASHYLRELAGILNADPANLSRELRRLEHEGLFISDHKGNQKHFRLNRGYPLYVEIRGIVAKTIGAIGKLKAALGRIVGIEDAQLYGSFARNQQDQASDIDILIIGKPEMADLEEALRTLERHLRREINYTLLTRDELESRLKKNDAFITNVWQDERINLLVP